MNPHRRLPRDVLYMRAENRATMEVYRNRLEDLVLENGCEVCGRTIEDIAREARPDDGPNTIVIEVVPCEDFDSLVDKWIGVLEVHVVCRVCRLHPLLTPEDALGTVRCPLALTEADRAMIALSEDHAR